MTKNAYENEHLKQQPQQMFENQTGKNTCPKMMTQTTSKTTRKITVSRVVCVWRGKRTYKHTHMLANVEKAQILRKVQKDHQRPRDARKQNNFRETNLVACVAGLAKSVESTPMLARIVPENRKTVLKHHSTNITPASFRTAPQSYQKAQKSYNCKPVSTNIVPTSQPKTRKLQQYQHQEQQPHDARVHLHEPDHVVEGKG